MARFVFRLDPVLAHRKRLEEEQQVVFAAAMQRLAAAQAIHDGYVAEREALRTRIRTRHGGMRGDELRAAYAHCSFLDKAIEAQAEVVARERRVADAERETLLEKTKDKKILETLRERRRETFEFEAAAYEQRASDEINSRYFDRVLTARETPS
jgi:flagellar FliJ protein